MNNSLKEEILNRRTNAEAALAKAKALEKRDLENGKRYFRVSQRTYILVECDKDGNPTERGRRSLERHIC